MRRSPGQRGRNSDRQTAGSITPFSEALIGLLHLPHCSTETSDISTPPADLRAAAPTLSRDAGCIFCASFYVSPSTFYSP